MINPPTTFEVESGSFPPGSPYENGTDHADSRGEGALNDGEDRVGNEGSTHDLWISTNFPRLKVESTHWKKLGWGCQLDHKRTVVLYSFQGFDRWCFLWHHFICTSYLLCLWWNRQSLALRDSTNIACVFPGFVSVELSRISWVHGGSRHSQILLNIFHQTHHLRTSSPFTVMFFVSHPKAIFLGIPFPLRKLCSSVCVISHALVRFLRKAKRDSTDVSSNIKPEYQIWWNWWNLQENNNRYFRKV